MTVDLQDPKYRQIAIHIRNYIEENCLMPGTKIPGGRKFADIYGVSKHTAYEALELLQGDGIIDIRKDSGSYVANGAWKEIRSKSPGWERFANIGWQHSGKRQTQELFRRVSNPFYTYVSMSALDSEFGLNTVIAEAMAKVAKKVATSNIAIGYDSFGPQALRSTVSKYLERKEIIANEREILIAPSVYIAFETVLKSLLRAGCTVYVSESIQGLQDNLLRSLGVNTVLIPNDTEGINLDKLKEIYKPDRLALVITCTMNLWSDCNGMGQSRREELLNWCRQERVPIVEIDTEGDLDHLNFRSLKSMDTNNNVLYIGSLPTYISYGMNVAWIVAPGCLNNRLADVLDHTHHFPMNVNYYLIEYLLSSRLYQQFMESFIPKMRKRIELTEELLQEHVAPYAVWHCNRSTSLFVLSMKDSAIAKRMFEMDSDIAFIGGNSHICILPCCLTEKKLRTSIEKLGKMMCSCSI